MGEWRALVAETVTGTIVSDVVLAAEPQFNRELGDRGSWTVELITDDKANREVDFHSYVRPAFYTWIVAYDDRPVQAGPTWTHSFNDADQRLTVSGSGLGGMFTRRVVRRASGNPATVTRPGNDLTYKNLSLRGILRQLVADNLTQPGYGLPVDLPAPETGSSTRTYRGYELGMMWDRMTDLMGVINGPEFDFAPIFTSNGAAVRWRLDLGTPLLGDQNTPSVWDYGGALSEIDLDVNGSNAPVSRVWVKGSGQDSAMLVGFAENGAAVADGFPGLDFVDSDHTSVELQQTLDDYAAQDLDDLGAAQETWKCTVRIDGLQSHGVDVSPRLGSWGLGDAPLFGVSGHPWIPDGTYRKRVLGFSQDETATLALKLGSTPLLV